MKTRVYLRVARTATGKTKVVAATKPTSRPVTDANAEPLPTVAFGIALEIPDVLFNRASQVIATLTIPEEQAVIAADVQDINNGSDT